MIRTVLSRIIGKTMKCRWQWAYGNDKGLDGGKGGHYGFNFRGADLLAAPKERFCFLRQTEASANGQEQQGQQAQVLEAATTALLGIAAGVAKKVKDAAHNVDLARNGSIGRVVDRLEWA